jgi:hypothetical protein
MDDDAGSKNAREKNNVNNSVTRRLLLVFIMIDTVFFGSKGSCRQKGIVRCVLKSANFNVQWNVMEWLWQGHGVSFYLLVVAGLGSALRRKTRTKARPK